MSRTLRRSLLEAAVLSAMSLLALVVYDASRLARFNPPNATDPWIYTGAMWNFDVLYRFFAHTYYLSRLPWIIPGYALNRAFSPETSFFILHIAFALAAAGSAFLIARRVYGRTAAFATFGALVTSLLFYDSYSTDYPDGAQITFLLVALAFAVFAYDGAWPRTKLGLAGFFAAAAVGTNLFAGLLVGCLALLYGLFVVTGLRVDVRARLLDAVAFVSGAATLVLACGAFAHAHGGPFLFFTPSLDAMSSISTAGSKPADNAWMRVEPRLFVPAFFLAFVAISWRRGRWRRDAGARLAAGSVVFLGVVTLVLTVWEFAGAGDFIFLTPYFRVLTVGFALCMAAGVAMLVERAGLGRDDTWTWSAVAAFLGGSAPTIGIYGLDHYGYTGRLAMVPVAFLMVATVVGALLVRGAPAAIRAPLVVGVTGLAAFSSNLAAAASSSVIVFSAATLSGPSGDAPNYQAQGPDAMQLSERFVHFMKVHRLEKGRAAFWFDTQAGQSPANGLTSLYLYGYWTVSRQLPKVDAQFERRLAQLAPKSLVLLCRSPSCAGAPAALRGAGYAIRLRAAVDLHAGRLRVDVRAYDLHGRRTS